MNMERRGQGTGNRKWMYTKLIIPPKKTTELTKHQRGFLSSGIDKMGKLNSSKKDEKREM